ncbi:MAG: hypothetical protein KFB97_11410 [Cyanobium sp. M30B3]|nr:MAG: hypothetical protein KFB97_11410 [Cyanobium sp. M30B3]
MILTTAGWALFTVFVLTVIGGLLPLQPRNLAWSQNISRLIVDAGSLALVGLCLVRYGSYLRSLDLPSRESLATSLRNAGRRSSASASSTRPAQSSPASSSGNLLSRLVARIFSGSARSGSRRDPFAVDQHVKDKLALERNKLWVRRMAIAGALGMLLLAPLQVVIFIRGAAALDLEFTKATLQQRQQFEQLETALRDAPAERLRQGWLQLKRLDPASAPATLPAPAAQLDDLIAEANRNRDSSLQSLRSQASGARFALGRDSLRVLLASLVYGWAFWAFFRRA